MNKSTSNGINRQGFNEAANYDEPKSLGAKSQPARDKKSQSDLILEIALKEAHVFKNDKEEIFASVSLNGATVTYRIKSMAFRAWLNLRFFQKFGRVAGSKGALEAAITTLSGIALSQNNADVFIRISTNPDVIYYDLGDETGRVVQVTPNGWRIINHSPVAFLRPKGMMAQVEPQQGGNIELLRQSINVKAEDFYLIVIWLLGFFQPFGSRPHLAQIAEQGTAKTTNTCNLRRVLDPNIAPTRKEPKEERDLMIAAQNNALLGFDNFSYMPQWLSDALCRLATGAGYATRAHYSDNEEEIFSLRRPVLFNGITDVVSSADLLDRLVWIELPLLTESQRKPESEINEVFEKNLPLILGALFDIVVIGLKNLPTTHLEKLPRMADFATWACACAPGLDKNAEEILSLYNNNRKNVRNIAAETSTLVSVIEEWVASRNDDIAFSGTATTLLDRLEAFAGFNLGPGSKKPPEDWPKSPRSLGWALKRMAPILRSRGLNVKPNPSNGKRSVVIEKISAVLEGDNAENDTENYQNGTEKMASGSQIAPNSAVSDVSPRYIPFYTEKEEKEEKGNVAGKNDTNGTGNEIRSGAL